MNIHQVDTLAFIIRGKKAENPSPFTRFDAGSNQELLKTYPLIVMIIKRTLTVAG